MPSEPAPPPPGLASPPPRVRRRDAVGRISPWLPVDGVLWAVLSALAVAIHYDFDSPAVSQVLTGPAFAVATTFMVLAVWVLGMATGLYRGRYVPGTIHEITALLTVFMSATLFVFLFVNLASFPGDFPRTSPLSTGAYAATIALAARFLVRHNELFGAGRKRDGVPAIVFGAGEGGQSLVGQLRRSDSSVFVPVAILDDDPTKHGMVIDGVKVVGSRRDIESVARRRNASALLIAAPTMARESLAELQQLGQSIDLDVVVMPALNTIMSNQSARGELKQTNVDDLLGRSPVRLNSTQVADSIRGKRVLITGAGGSIGSELARQINLYRPAQLFLLDRDESGLHGTQLSLERQAMLDSPNTLLVSIRDRGTLHDTIVELSPDIVFHAAALKHLPLLERFPLEAIRTNIAGTQNLIESARDAGVSTFVNISTDKAANPTSVLGHTKRLAERLTAAAAHDARTERFVSVRFGNVLGSRGSVLTTFEHQIAAGGPVTVTDRDVTRYFMTIQEACRLVLQAAAVGQNGETLVLDMGEPVRIADVANMLIQQSGRSDIDVVFTGLRENEKLVEHLFDDSETPQPCHLHSALSVVRVKPLRCTDDELSSLHNNEEAREWLRHAVDR